MITRRSALTLGGCAVCGLIGMGQAFAADPQPLAGYILKPGPAGHCDDARVGVGTPLWSPRDKLWMLWYYCKSADFDPVAPPSLASGYMALATSKDGLQWTRFNGPGPGGSILWPSSDPSAFDSLHLGATDVIYHKGQYWMWYYGGDRSTKSKDSRGNQVLGFRTLMGLARSPDGYSWTKVKGPGPGGSLFDAQAGAAYASWPSVVYDGRKFMMYYTSTDSSFEILNSLLAYSSDGLTWIQQGPIVWADAPVEWDSKGIIARQVIRNPFAMGGRWLMIYAGIDSNPARFKRRAIAAATSDDGVVWRRLYRKPIFTVGDSGGWDAGEVTAPHIVVAGKETRLYYLGGPAKADAERFARGLGLAISDTGDLKNFKRYISPDGPA